MSPVIVNSGGYRSGMDRNATVGSEKIRALFDDGSFVEVGAYVKGADGGEYDGVLCGYGSVGGKLAFAFSQDMDRTKGAFDASGAKKIRMLYEMAMKNGAPVIGIFDSEGAVIREGASALSAYGTWMRVVSEASGVLPQIAVITGVCAGSAAVIASMFDVVLAAGENASLYVTASSVVGKQGTGVNSAAEKGLVSVVCDGEADAFARVRTLMDLLPQNNCDKATVDAPEIGAVAADTVLPEGILDGAAFVELSADFGKDVRTGFGRVGGVPVGVVRATGALTADGARKAAHLVEFCDSFGMAVVTLVDSDGLAIRTDDEAQSDISSYGRLATAYASATCPKVTVVTGHAYGAAYILLGSKALGADMTYALPQAVISTMAPERAVAFLWNDRVSAEVSRESLEKEWTETMASPEAAAAGGDIDDIIPPEQLRMRVCSALYMLAAKTDDRPTRRHTVAPL